MLKPNLHELANKDELIHQLLKYGIYKKDDKQLYELSIFILEWEFNQIRGE